MDFGFDLRQMLRGDGEGALRGSQVFSNATAPIFQSAGHAIAGLTGGSTFGGLLNGTIFDPKNKGVDGGPANVTAKQTTRTADEGCTASGLLLTGNVDTTSGNAIDPSNALGTASTTLSSGATATIAAINGSLGPSGGSPLGVVGKVLGIESGSSSWLYKRLPWFPFW